MTKLLETLTLAEEALDMVVSCGYGKSRERVKNGKALAAIRDAKAELVKEAKQEPVGYFTYDGDYNIWEEAFSKDTYGAVPLYTHPVRTKDLTDAFINELHKDAQDPISFARAVIAADREKNRG